MTGRPTDYSDEKATQICERLIGGESLRTICKEDGMPDASTVYRWLAKDENAQFREQYARAREGQAEYWANEILEIADTPQLGVTTKTSEDGVEVTEGDMLTHRKLQIDTRKWLMSKLLPKKYGDAMTLKGDKEAPLTVSIDLGHD